jgi:hypothetical protein
LNNYRGEKKPEKTSKIIARYAMIEDDGPTANYFNEKGEMPW